MNINDIRRKLKIALVVLGVYILISLIVGAILVAREWAPFGVGFVLTAISGGALYWLLTNKDR